jgi:very-short-patch-repair endonuclease
VRIKIEEQVPKELFEKMVEVARLLRRDATAAEETLWQALRGRNLLGAKFRRQQPIGPFVADFYCHEQRLVVEVDGPIHRSRRAADLQRDKLLEAAGFRVLRIPSENIERSLTAVLERIESALRAQTSLSQGEWRP